MEWSVTQRMSVDLNFWKYQDGVYLDNAMVYQKACCDHERVEGLALLPAEDILRETAAAFPEWTALGPLDYEREGHGSFQISASPQAVRFDCCSMKRADMKRFAAVLSKFGCPLYDPQQGVRFDKICAFLEGEAGEYQTQVEQGLSRLLPQMEISARAVTWEESVLLSKTCGHIQYNAAIHRAKTMTKASSFLRFGGAWANRSCQCRTAQPADGEQARRVLEELLQKSMERVVEDFLERTYYEALPGVSR